MYFLLLVFRIAKKRTAKLKACLSIGRLKQVVRRARKVKSVVRSISVP